MTNLDVLTLMSEEEQSVFLRNSANQVDTRFPMQTMWNFNRWLAREYKEKTI